MDPNVGGMKTAKELLETEYPPLRWAIEGVIPFGALTVIGGKAKAARKSWVMGELALAVSDGGDWLGQFHAPMAGSVLYIGNEDTPRRLKNRLTILSTGRERDDDDNGRLNVATEFDSYEQGGLVKLQEWVAMETHPALIIIDVLANFREVRGFYNRDRKLIQELALFARTNMVALVVVMHMHKGKIREGQDWTDKLQGSAGVSASADVLIGIDAELGAKEGRMLITGKDVESGAFKLALAPDKQSWTITGPDLPRAGGRQVSSQRELLLNVIADNGGCKAPEIHAIQPRGSDGKKWSVEAVRQTLFQMWKAEQVVNENGRFYTHEQVAERQPAPAPAPAPEPEPAPAPKKSGLVLVA